MFLALIGWITGLTPVLESKKCNESKAHEYIKSKIRKKLSIPILSDVSTLVPVIKIDISH